MLAQVALLQQQAHLEDALGVVHRLHELHRAVRQALNVPYHHVVGGAIGPLLVVDHLGVGALVLPEGILAARGCGGLTVEAGIMLQKIGERRAGAVQTLKVAQTAGCA